MKKLYILTLFLLFFCSLISHNSGKVLYEDALVTEPIYSQDSTYVEYWENGTMKLEKTYQIGKRREIWRKWNEKSELIEKKDFKKGVLRQKTVYEYYTHTQHLLFEQKTFDSDNKLMERRSYLFQNNNKCSVIEYYSNGKIKSSGRIINNKKDGKWINYDESGAILSKEKFKKGIHANNPNIDITRKREQEKEREEEILIKAKKDSIEKAILTKEVYNNYRFNKGLYTTLKGEIINCYFKDKSVQSGKPFYKIGLYEKGEVLQLNNVKTITFGGKKYTVIDEIRLKACSMIGAPIYRAKLTTNIIEGRINLYSTIVSCFLVEDNKEQVISTAKVFIVKKGSNGVFQEMILYENKFRESIKSLVKDNRKTMLETGFEGLDYEDLIPLINNYNSNTKDTASSLNEILDEEVGNSNEVESSCQCMLKLSRKMFEKSITVNTRKECCLVMTGLRKNDSLKIFTSNQNINEGNLLSKGVTGKNKIKLELSSLKIGTYYLSFAEDENVWRTTLTIK